MILTGLICRHQSCMASASSIPPPWTLSCPHQSYTGTSYQPRNCKEIAFQPQSCMEPFCQHRTHREFCIKCCDIFFNFHQQQGHISSPFSHSKIVRWSFLHVLNIIKLSGKLRQCLRISEETLRQKKFILKLQWAS